MARTAEVVPSRPRDPRSTSDKEERMEATEAQRGSAGVQGDLWGARAADWAELQEPQQRPLYEDAVRRLGIGDGTRLLEVGCGAGELARLAAEAGADVTGIDAAASLVAIARGRVPAGRFDVGDLQFLPYADDSFDVVTGINSFQYAADPVAALEEARRVAEPGGLVHVVVWGREEHTEFVAVLRALRPLLPPAPPNAPGPFALSNPGALEALLERSGLAPVDAGYLDVTFVYPDEATLLGANRSAGPAILAERTSGEAALVDAIREAFAPFRAADGSYRVETEWRYVTATA
jgi:SAM-dependent methyltransferase